MNEDLLLEMNKAFLSTREQIEDKLGVKRRTFFEYVRRGIIGVFTREPLYILETWSSAQESQMDGLIAKMNNKIHLDDGEMALLKELIRKQENHFFIQSKIAARKLVKEK